MKVTDENMDYADCPDPNRPRYFRPDEDLPDYIKARMAEVAHAKAAPPKPRLQRVPDFGIHPDELARIRGARPTTEAGIATLIVDEAELAAKGRWGGQPEPPRWIPPSAAKPPKLIAASELFDDGPYCDFARRPRP
jgi:hypothetical protein